MRKPPPTYQDLKLALAKSRHDLALCRKDLRQARRDAKAPRREAGYCARAPTKEKVIYLERELWQLRNILRRHNLLPGEVR